MGFEGRARRLVAAQRHLVLSPQSSVLQQVDRGHVHGVLAAAEDEDQADNVVPVVRNDVLSRGADLRQLADRVSQTLTTADLTDLNKQVSIDHMDAKDVAAAYLKAKNLVR